MSDDIVTPAAGDQLAFFFLAQGEQTAEAVMARLTNFIARAKRSLDFAFYDMRLGDSLENQFRAALKERAAAGVDIRICFDGDKPLRPNLAAGQDPAPPGTSAFVQSLGYPWRRIAGMKLMHHKFIVIDFDQPTARVYLGSYNFSEAADVSNGENLLLIRDRRIAVSYVIEALRIFDHYHFRVLEQEAKEGKRKLQLAKPPRNPGEKPWWARDYTNAQKIRDRELFA